MASKSYGWDSSEENVLSLLLYRTCASGYCSMLDILLKTQLPKISSSENLLSQIPDDEVLEFATTTKFLNKISGEKYSASQK